MYFSAILKRYKTILSFIFISLIIPNGSANAKTTIIATDTDHSIQQTTIGKPLSFSNKNTKANIQLAKAANKKHHPKQKTKYKKKKITLAEKYRRRVRLHLAKHRVHPGQFLKGRVVLSFIISRSGEVSHIKLSRRSHFKQLNRAALAMVVLASPFPRIPHGGPSRMSFTVPISFR